MLKMLLDDSTKPGLKFVQKKNRQKCCTDKGRVEVGGGKTLAIPLNFSIIEFCSEKKKVFTLGIHELL